jgi:cytochrome c biogenesis protein CcmG/thiol:disulfide interchange protein DsbE
MSQEPRVLEPRRVTRRTVLQGAGAWSVGGLTGWFARDARADDLRVGGPAPVATLVTLDDRRISTAQLRGDVVILTFWATWCVPCREELPLLSAYATRHREAGLKVLGFTLDTPEKLPEVKQISESLSFPVGFLERSSAPGYGRIWRLPVSFTIDRAGRLVVNGWKEKNPSWTAERLEQVVTPLLEAAKS